jgi:hypothetical protein
MSGCPPLGSLGQYPTQVGLLSGGGVAGGGGLVCPGGGGGVVCGGGGVWVLGPRFSVA